MNFKLSPSAINLMIDCPRCFWLAKHDVWKRPPSIFPSLPSGMDRVLKEHFDRFMEKGELPPELCQKEECNGLRLFNDKEKLEIWRNNFKGISTTDKDGNILFGAVDNILVKDNKLIVLDYKTRGYPCKDDTHEHYRLQLDIYNFLLRLNGYDTENYSYLLFYIPKEVSKTGEFIFDITLKKIDVNIKNASDKFSEAINLLEGECPKESCEWCEEK